MKYLSFIILLLACGNHDPAISLLKKKAEDAKCKAEKAQFYSEMEGTIEYAIRKGMGEEYDSAFMAFGDSTLTCRQADSVFQVFQDKLHDKLLNQ